MTEGQVALVVLGCCFIALFVVLFGVAFARLSNVERKRKQDHEDTLSVVNAIHNRFSDQKNIQDAHDMKLRQKVNVLFDRLGLKADWVEGGYQHGRWVVTAREIDTAQVDTRKPARIPKKRTPKTDKVKIEITQAGGGGPGA